MTKNKNKDSIKASIDALSISSVVGGETFYPNSIKGKTISLNQKAESFFGVGSIWLDSQKYSCVVPDTITSQQEEIIRTCLRQGIVVEGDRYIAPIDKDREVLNEYWHLIKTHGLSHTDPKSKSMPKFRALFRNGTDRNWTAKEVSRFCMEEEKKYKNREPILKLLNEMFKYSDSPATLLEEPSKK